MFCDGSSRDLRRSFSLKWYGKLIFTSVFSPDKIQKPLVPEQLECFPAPQPAPNETSNVLPQTVLDQAEESAFPISTTDDYLFLFKWVVGATVLDCWKSTATGI